MKAAVLHEAGGVPRYEDFPDPVAADGEVIIDVKAVAVENVDKAIAAGTHYAGEKYIGRFPVIPAFDGVGALPDGTLVGFGGIRLPYGALAEKTVVPQGSYVPIPEGVDPAVASVMASAVTAMSMEAAAGFVPGETVLVLGATGVAGRLAVKVARLLGAGRIVATGRDDHQLREVRAIGADAVINTAVSDEALARAYLDARGTATTSSSTTCGAGPARSCCARWCRGRSRLASRPAWSRSASRPAPNSPSPRRACVLPERRSTARPRGSTRGPWRRCTSGL
ncbi:hypothetical protein GCM10027612_50120 [Microbispora bryophytorum subsp. camponoti]